MQPRSPHQTGQIRQLSVEALPNDEVPTPAVVLTIAGSDSGGGAGLQADLKTFAALGTHGTTAITAVTAQNTVSVAKIEVLPVEIIEQQIRMVIDDLAPKAFKTGMLASTDVVNLVADLAEEGLLPNLVVDPVMVATSGDRLVPESTEKAYLERLFSHAEVITPNAVEAGVFCGRKLVTVEDLHLAAEELRQSGASVVVVKGGHIDGDESVDVIWDGSTRLEISAPRVETSNTHGTGCSFAAAVAAELAKGTSTLGAIERAKRFVACGIVGAQNWQVGQGHGPIDHFATFER